MIIDREPSITGDETTDADATTVVADEPPSPDVGRKFLEAATAALKRLDPKADPTQAAVAEAVGLRRGHLNDYVHERRSPGLGQVARWLDAWRERHPTAALGLEYLPGKGWEFFEIRR